jgi:hypothetical protein
MPSLQDLPLELRQKIYALAISSSDTTKIAAYPRQNNSGRRSTEVALPVLEDGQAQCTRNHNTSLLWVSKQVSADARPILYGYHKFTFETTRALELFLDQIGDMKQYLRHVALGPCGYEHDSGPQDALYGATKRSFTMLAAATGLQTLVVSHYDFCRIRHKPEPKNAISNLVSASAQLLQAICNARNARGLKVDLASSLEIVKIQLPNCLGCATCGTSGVHMSSKRIIGFKQGSLPRRLRCYCRCNVAEANNQMLMENFKRSVSETLHVG